MFARTALRLGRRIAAPAVPIHTARPLALPLHRAYASLSPDTPPPAKAYEVFDEDGKTRQKDRAILRLREQQEAGELEDPQVLDYIREEVADRITERIETPPAIVVELSSHAGQLTRMLQEVLGDKLHPSTEPGGVMGQEKRKWIMVEPSSEALNRDDDSTFLCELTSWYSLQKYADKVDAIVSAGGLHWVGDIVGAFTQAKHLLKPDGVFIAAVLGGDTLFELRTSLQLAEQERRGGIANRVSPMITAADSRTLRKRGRHGSGDVPDDFLHRLEAGPEPAQAARARLGQDEPEGRVVECAGSHRLRAPTDSHPLPPKPKPRPNL
ncbi:hypothetical protein A1Q2_03941 [Trichosporon asahii var. asahii CBS 8904]|uniref:Methyltransferase type 11 domain-containing protein n=1 Tax=Trichosporon asahii var. asahii (strain CBS 8904) TaxID=1220162 RepID=K1WK74_TRIAC|nr:hypothetical protein A1Q2_03941 [Trichosporon asahii var. asahii CBS 8904]